MNNFVATIICVFFVTGCSVTPEKLASMSSIEVCKQMGYAQWDSEPLAYLHAKAEAKKRIKSGSVEAEDCEVFSQMAIRSREKAAVKTLTINNNQSVKTEGCFWMCINGEWAAVKNGVCNMPNKPVTVCQ